MLRFHKFITFVRINQDSCLGRENQQCSDTLTFMDRLTFHSNSRRKSKISLSQRGVRVNLVEVSGVLLYAETDITYRTFTCSKKVSCSASLRSKQIVYGY